MADSPAKLARDLFVTAGTTAGVVAAVVAKATAEVKVEAVRNSRASSGQSARKAPDAITSEIGKRRTMIEGVVGYEARGQGNLGHLLEYGSSLGNVRNPPHRDLGRALDNAEQGFVDDIGRAAVVAFTRTRGGI